MNDIVGAGKNPAPIQVDDPVRAPRVVRADPAHQCIKAKSDRAPIS